MITFIYQLNYLLIYAIYLGIYIFIQKGLLIILINILIRIPRSMSQYNSNLNNKRKAFHFDIRKQFISDLFTQRRKQLIEQNNAFNPQIQSLLSQPITHSQVSNINNWLKLKAQQVIDQAVLCRIVQRIQKYARSIDYVSSELVEFTANFLSRDNSNILMFTPLILDNIVACCCKQVYARDKSFSEIICWMLICIYRKNSELALFNQVPLVYNAIISKVGLNNPFLLCLWAQLSQNHRLLPQQKYLVQLLETREAFQTPQSISQIMVDEGNQISQKQQGSERGMLEQTLYRIMQIEANFLYFISQGLIKKKLSMGEQIQFLKWICFHLQVRLVSASNKWSLIEMLGLLIQTGLAQEANDFIFESFLYSELVTRAKIDFSTKKLLVLDVLTALVLNSPGYRVRWMIKQSDIVKVIVKFLRIEQPLVVINMLKAIAVLLDTCTQDTKIQMIASYYERQVKFLLHSKNQKIFQLTDAINNEFFSQFFDQ